MMELQDALSMAREVLVQERITPTLTYFWNNTMPLRAAIGAAANPRPLQHNKYYYQIQDPPGTERFESRNFDLLSRLLGSLPLHDQNAFVQAIASHLLDGQIYNFFNVDPQHRGTAQSSSSEAPLVAEFLVRHSQTSQLLNSLSQVPVSPALTHLLLQIRSMVARNYQLFTASELSSLSSSAVRISQVTSAASEYTRLSRVMPDEMVTRHVKAEVPLICLALIEECREARYLYIKIGLTTGANFEINQDKTRVEGFLEQLGFTSDLAASLNMVETLYRTASDEFDLKSSMGHLRSFVENLSVQACNKLEERTGQASVQKWGQAMNYLVQADVLSEPEQKFAIHFYTLLSDTAVHPLRTSREHARLLRNMSIELGLLVLQKLEFKLS